eukprot:TRINITY_DN29209_c0_g1_i1.p1 TRINITY_DN29209_c0_g1~~TRINITY_DN29209_c0_g1_i1.p1  ORF type:complete len:455 (+),score=83.02 TRINITY_DN29209_c0_g1_i1:92-1366(+)
MVERLGEMETHLLGMVRDAEQMLPENDPRHCRINESPVADLVPQEQDEMISAPVFGSASAAVDAAEVAAAIVNGEDDESSSEEELSPEDLCARGYTFGSELERTLSWSGAFGRYDKALTTDDPDRDSVDFFDVGGGSPVGTLTDIEPSELMVVNSAGIGSTANVFKAMWRGRRVAVKELHLKGGSRLHEIVKVGFSREIEVLKRTRHPNLVTCLGVTTEPFSVVSEFCSGGTAFELLHSAPLNLAWWQRFKMARDVALAMDYLHGFSPQIIHRDLKSPNILLKRQVTTEHDALHSKVADFGMARMKDTSKGKDLSATAGTFHWMAPEILSGTYDEKVDVYSYAIFLYEIMYNALPFDDHTGPSVLRRTMDGERADLWTARSAAPGVRERDALVSLTQGCWAHVPSMRPSFSSVLESLQELNNAS